MKGICLSAKRLLLIGIGSFGLIGLAVGARAAVELQAKCLESKAKAAGQEAAAILKAFGKDAKKPDGGKLAVGISKAESKFQKSFTKAESKGGCAADGDASGVEAEVGDFTRLALCDGPLGQETISIAASAEPAETPGSSGVDNSNYPKLVTMFGGTSFSLNKVTYTRYYCGNGTETPDAVLVLVPGFEGGAASFRILADNAIPRARARGVKLEIWGYDRRGHQLEDLAGLDIAEANQDAGIALDWLYGGELGLPLNGALAAGPNRRAVFHNTNTDTAFIANWTGLVLSHDINDLVDAARAVVPNQNVFLGGHSAGTGFTARYAATDFDLSGAGPADPGYAKVRGLVLLEGGGGSTAGGPPSAATLDAIEDSADGGLFFAVRNQDPRCVDGTACTADSDCTGLGRGTCTQPTAAYAVVPGLLNARILAAGEVTAIQAITDPDVGPNLLTVDFGSDRCVGGTNAGDACLDNSECDSGACRENDAIRQVSDLGVLAVLGEGTALGGLGAFLDDDGLVSQGATFVRTSVGAPGPVVGGLKTWQDITEGLMPPNVLPDNGPAPTTLQGAVWGQEIEVTRMDRIIEEFFLGDTNFTDWYYPSSGLGTTSGLPSLDSNALSVGRGRHDIENLTQAANVNVPVICFGASNGLTPVPGDYVGFAESIGACTAPSCDGTTPRVVNATSPNEAFPILGGVAGGFEVHISEGYAHVDIVTAEDGPHNQVIGPLVDFIYRNVQ